MSTTYIGQAFPPDAQENPMPQSGIAPVVELPADIDSNNVATMFTDQYRKFADNLAFLQLAAKWRPASTPAATPFAGVGFTTVVHTGAGSGVVAAPAGTGNNSGADELPVIKIIAGGAVGVATFQWSNDGGNTYGSTIVTVSPYTDPVSGITVTFSGTFTATDTYSFRATDTPAARFLDNYTGESHAVVDHMGFLCPRYQTFAEDWDFPPSTNPVVASGGFPGYNKWTATLVGGGAAITIGNAAIGAGNYNTAVHIGGTTSRFVSTATFTPVDGSTWIFEFIRLTSSSTFGLAASPATTAVLGVGGGLQITGGTGHFRFELGFGAASPLLGNYRAFLNGKFMASGASPIVAGTAYQIVANGTASHTVGPIRLHRQVEANPTTLGGL